MNIEDALMNFEEGKSILAKAGKDFGLVKKGDIGRVIEVRERYDPNEFSLFDDAVAELSHEELEKRGIRDDKLPPYYLFHIQWPCYSASFSGYYNTEDDLRGNKIELYLETPYVNPDQLSLELAA